MIKWLCEKMTNHRFNKLEGWIDCDPAEYYYKCRLCRRTFWSYDIKKEDLENIVNKNSNMKG